MVRILFVMLLAMVTTATGAQKQKQAPGFERPGIELSGVKVQLGLTKNQVLQRMNGIKMTVANDSTWYVGDLGSKMEFTGNELTYAERVWNGPSDDVRSALAGAVNSLNSDGIALCRASTMTMASEPSGVMVALDCGDKSIAVAPHVAPQTDASAGGGAVYTAVIEKLGPKSAQP